ncbi:MAG: hypothetical protein H0U59_10925 [Gemmatimonadaceae bacterium]|nr:hypothetical protein [Gemmatimonadaceae bacterium]
MAHAVLKPVEKPEGYKPPEFSQVEEILGKLKNQRQPAIDRTWEYKRIRRSQWDDVLRKVPSAYRKMLVDVDAPQLRDMANRIAGLIAKHEPEFEVIPPSHRIDDVHKASKEEARLTALRLQIEDQQDRSIYAMGIDAQINWGESWISVWPDPRRLNDPAYDRGEEESAKEYVKRVSDVMSEGGIPICIQDHDMQTVFPFGSDYERLALCIVETEHMELDINLGYGYKAIRDPEGKAKEWTKGGTTLSEPYVATDARSGESGGVIDVTHDRGQTNGNSPRGSKAVRKVVFMDCWVYQMWLDGVIVEEWEHNYGVVPMFPARGTPSSDRDPGWQTQGLMDPAVSVAKQVVMFSAILASSAMQYGFPTPILKNPDHGLVDSMGRPIVRTLKLGEMNLMGPNEELEFPLMNAQMNPDFFKYLDYLNGTMEDVTLSNFGKALGSDIAGYAIAQIRSMQMSILAPVYKDAERQWRKIAYFLRHMIKTTFPAGMYLRGAVETAEVEGKEIQYRPVLEYAKEHCTDFSIDCHIDEGVKQDEIAERKSAIEMKESGMWSPRRAMEHVGVNDPDQEEREIRTHRSLNSPAADQVRLQMAMELVMQRMEATRQDQSSPFYQALEKAKQAHMGGGGQFQNQGSQPANALPGGQPVQQNPPVPAPQQGGPQEGPGSLAEFGVPQMPGGVQQQRVQP